MVRRRAFTLVELLVVIAIIAILIGLLLPTVQMSREAARSASCRNNLRQIGLGVQMYVESTGFYPPGNAPQTRLQEDTRPFGGATWLISILPFVEQRGLYESYQFKVHDGSGIFVANDRTTNREVRTASVSTYLCPSDTADGAVVPTDGGATLYDPPLEYMPGSYRAMSGVIAFPEPGQGEVTAVQPKFRMIATSAIHDMPNAQTPLTRPRDITDGLSNTLLVGENTDRTIPGQGTLWANPYPYYTLSTASIEPLTLQGDYNRCFQKTGVEEPCKRGWGSAHLGGLNFLLGDGSVRRVQTSIDMMLFIELSTIAGGEPAQLVD